jgi:transglutaminase-like putative cysteine protease
MEDFLRPTYFVNSDDATIREKANELTKECKNDRERAVALFNFVRDGITYNPYGPVEERERYKASATLARGYGYCIQKATLLAALLRSIGIPGALIFADIINPLIPEHLRDALKTDRFIYHCYNHIFLEGRWLKATCALDSGTCGRIGVPEVEFDGHKDAIFPPFLRDGTRFVTYYNDRGIRPDVPFEEIIREFKAYYGEEVLKATATRNP